MDFSDTVDEATFREDARAWLAANSWAPGSLRMWQRLADKDSAPCSPCRIEDSDQRAFSLASLIFCFSSSRSATAVLSSGTVSGGRMYAFSTSKGVEKST